MPTTGIGDEGIRGTLMICKSFPFVGAPKDVRLIRKLEDIRGYNTRYWKIVRYSPLPDDIDAIERYIEVANDSEELE